MVDQFEGSFPATMTMPGTTLWKKADPPFSPSELKHDNFALVWKLKYSKKGPKMLIQLHFYFSRTVVRNEQGVLQHSLK